MLPVLRLLRGLIKSWQLTVVAVFSLSVAMALVVLSISAANTALLAAPAAFEPDRLVMIHGRSSAKSIDQISWLDYLYYRDHNQVFTDIAADPNSISLFIDTAFASQPVRAMSRPVSANHLPLLGIRPFLGRFFSPADDSMNPHTAVMTYAFWKRLGARRDIVGKRFGAYTIIGVTPPRFTGSFYGLDGDLLTPLAENGDNPWLRQRETRRFFLLARLKPGVTRRQAQAAVSGLAAQLAAAYPKEDAGRTAVVTRATMLPPDALPTAEMACGVLIALVLLILLIACANVANLLLARSVGRRQEAAIKLALGAPRHLLVREFLRESIALCFLSAALGYAVALLVANRFSDFTLEFPMYGAYNFVLDLRLDFTVLACTLALTLLAVLATGLAPALYASSPSVANILSGEIAVGGTGRAAWRNALVVVQVAVSTVVLVGLGLCQRNLYNLRHADLGFTARNLLATSAYLASEGYSEAQGKQLYSRFRQAVSQLPGVQAVSLARDLPLQGGSILEVRQSGAAKKLSVTHTVVDSDYFRTVGIPLLAGRVFDSTDREHSPETAVINREMSDTLWPGQNALGKTFLAGDPARSALVVGVVANGKYEDVDEPRRPFFYYPLSQHYQPGINIIARTAGDPRFWTEPFDRAIRAQGLKTPVRPATFQSWFNLTLLAQRLVAMVMAALTALGLLLAALGLSGAVAYSVSRRARELGLRVALGAGPRQLLVMILRQVARVAGTGILIGLLLGSVTGVVLRAQFYGIGPVEWTVLLPAALLMLALSLLTAWISARPWIHADPMKAVRHN